MGFEPTENENKKILVAAATIHFVCWTMANSYIRLVYHFIWSTKDRSPIIPKENEERLWAFIAGIARKNGMHAIRIGGIENHIHALVELPKELTIPEAAKRLKGGSSAWCNETGFVRGRFQWQDGYGAFTVSPSMIPEVDAYIANQRDHHRRRTFEEEYIEFLKKHGIEYDERYTWG